MMQGRNYMQFILIVLVGVFAEVSLKLGFPREAITNLLIKGLELVEKGLGVGLEQLFK